MLSNSMNTTQSKVNCPICNKLCSNRNKLHPCKHNCHFKCFKNSHSSLCPTCNLHVHLTTKKHQDFIREYDEYILTPAQYILTHFELPGNIESVDYDFFVEIAKSEKSKEKALDILVNCMSLRNISRGILIPNYKMDWTFPPYLVSEL